MEKTLLELGFLIILIISNEFYIEKLKYIFFIGGNKHKMDFFQEFIYDNQCVVSRKINELLIEFDINNCEQIL